MDNNINNTTNSSGSGVEDIADAFGAALETHFAEMEAILDSASQNGDISMADALQLQALMAMIQNLNSTASNTIRAIKDGVTANTRNMI